MTSLSGVMADLPRRFPGPGGVCAVLRDGSVIEQHAWGWADAERRIPFTSQTLFRICSITKQFTCALVLERSDDLGHFDDAVANALPGLSRPPRTMHLCNNQSGLRDYWAVAMLQGSPAEAPFGDGQATRLIRGTRSLQFSPGSRYSYANQNFRILSDLLEADAGRSYAELLRTRIFDRVGMSTALLAADTAALPDGTQGYEGSQALGFRPARNRVIWTGDAGIAASLDDMIAWERWIDATRHDPASLYQRLSAPVTFVDGAPADYGFGLGRRTMFGRAVTAHGGALRGWRSHRLHVASDRLSIVVLFNHMGDAQHAAHLLLAAAVGEPVEAATEPHPMPPLAGSYLEPETGLAVRIQPGPPGTVLLRYDRFPEALTINGDGSAGRADGVRLRRDGDAIWMDRATDHQSSQLTPLDPAARGDVAGRYHCSELDTELTIEGAGSALYGAFSGFLGTGRMELLDVVARDVWTLPCPRGLDHTPPGDWTLAFERDGSDKAIAVVVGCWLARGLRYQRVG